MFPRKERQLMIVDVNGKVYQMSLSLYQNVLTTAKDAVKASNCIYALEKDGRIEMRRDIFPDIKTLKAEAKQYIRLGFTVHYTLVA